MLQTNKISHDKHNWMPTAAIVLMQRRGMRIKLSFDEHELGKNLVTINITGCLQQLVLMQSRGMRTKFSFDEHKLGRSLVTLNILRIGC